MVNGLCFLESVQGLGFSYCIPNKVQFWLMIENYTVSKTNFLKCTPKMPNLQGKKGTGNSNIEQTVIFMELFVLQIKIFQI